MTANESRGSIPQGSSKVLSFNILGRDFDQRPIESQF